jgi:hypothetical protein
VIDLVEPFAPFLSLLALPPRAWIDTTTLTATRRRLRRVAAIRMAAQRSHHADIQSAPRTRQPDGVEGVRYRIIPEPFTRDRGVRSRARSMCSRFPTRKCRAFVPTRTGRTCSKRPELRVSTSGSTTEVHRPARPRALNHAINVPAHRRVLASGEAVPAHGSVPPGTSRHTRAAGLRVRSGASRAALLAEAGLPNGLSRWRSGSARARKGIACWSGVRDICSPSGITRPGAARVERSSRKR